MFDVYIYAIINFIRKKGKKNKNQQKKKKFNMS